MVRINKKKQKEYVDKLYNGIKKRYKDKLKEKNNLIWNNFYKSEVKVERKNPSPDIRNQVVKNCKNKCSICGLPYDNKSMFSFHHINGDPSTSFIRNLILVCNNHHALIHSEARSKLAEYKIRMGKREQKGRGNIWAESGIPDPDKIMEGISKRLRS